jgi:DNA-binding MurR/RpiR family transcriptional regulator
VQCSSFRGRTLLEALWFLGLQRTADHLSAGLYGSGSAGAELPATCAQADKSNRGRPRGSDIAREFIEGSRHGLDELESGLDADAFDQALDLLVRAKTIYIAGVRRSFAPASYLAYALQHTRKRVILAPGLGGMHREQISSIRKGDALVAISFLPYGKETQYCVRMAHHNKAGALVITDSQLSSLARFASVLLIVKEGNAFGFRSLTNTMCLCQALFISLAYKLELNIEQTQEDPTEVP